MHSRFDLDGSDERRARACRWQHPLSQRIKGSGTYGIVVGATTTLLPGPTVSVETDNLFALKRLGNFVAQGASLFIGPGANGNAFVGNFPTLAGNVAGNDVITRSQ